MNYILCVVLYSGFGVTGPDVILMGANLTLVHYSFEQPTVNTPFNTSIKLAARNFQLPSGEYSTRENMMVVLYDLKGIYIRGSYWFPSGKSR